MPWRYREAVFVRGQAAEARCFATAARAYPDNLALVISSVGGLGSATLVPAMISTTAALPAVDREKAEAIKGEANDMFKRGKYHAAADKYTEAIAFAPDNEVLFVNRALCQRRLERWEHCEADAREALRLHSGHMKARMPWPPQLLCSVLCQCLHGAHCSTPIPPRCSAMSPPVRTSCCPRMRCTPPQGTLPCRSHASPSAHHLAT